MVGGLAVLTVGVAAGIRLEADTQALQIARITNKPLSWVLDVYARAKFHFSPQSDTDTAELDDALVIPDEDRY